MDVTFGSITENAPEGFLARRIHFTQLVALDTGTKEGFLTRIIDSAGFGTRELPLPITGQAPGRGHEGAFPVGTLNQVRMSGSNVEGWGWLANDDHGRAAFRELAMGMVRGNSIEMTDVRLKLTFDWIEEDDGSESAEITARFTQANIGATTLVMKPAFPESRATLDEEITAALEIEGDLDVTSGFEVHIDDPEIAASARIELPHEAFDVPEPDTYHPFTVDPDTGFACGHLGRYGQPHTGLAGRVTIPRSRTNYASFCKRKFPTDKGHVFTGPVILLGGHKATAQAINDALADPANSWLDVRVVDGKIGPWVCGMVRPGVPDAALHAGMGSGISGHWKNGELYAICSVSAEGFDVPRPGRYSIEAYSVGDDEYLAASFSLTEGEGAWPGFTSLPLSAEPDYEGALVAARAALEDDNGTTPNISNPDSLAQAVIGRR